MLPRIKLNGNELAKKIGKKINQTIMEEKSKHQIFYKKHQELAVPQLHLINFGFDAATLSYIKKKMDLAKMLGIKFYLHEFIDHQSEARSNHIFEKIGPSLNKDEAKFYYFNRNDKQCVFKIIQIIQQLNKNKSISAILVQLPLPEELNQFKWQIIQSIDPSKDADCLTLINRAKLIEHVNPQVLPCTPAGVMKIFDQYGLQIQGKKTVIVGRSSLVGLPLFHLMLNRNATINLCHRYTQNLNKHTEQADIVISAVGTPNLITKLKPDSIAIDIGISRNKQGKLNGDISQSAKNLCYFSTPVPGGVGPLTVSMLMSNTVSLWKRQMQIKRNQIYIKS